MDKIYFHIGFGKTGSSALQNYLSLNPQHDLPDSNKKIMYCSFQKAGGILYGEELKRAAERTVLKYIVSDPNVAKRQSYTQICQDLTQIIKAGYTPVFSNEAWGSLGKEFLSADFFTRINCTVHLVVYVRPQLEWFNSGWWQWWAWVDEIKDPADFVNTRKFYFLKWSERINIWKNIPNVESVSVRLHCDDIVKDFLHELGVTEKLGNEYEKRYNTGLSPLLIKLLLNYKGIREIHSAYVDAILSQYLPFEGQSPWVIDTHLAEKIISETRDDNLKLMSMLDADDRQKMKDDSRWWDKDYYRDRKVWSAEDLELTREDMDELLKQAIPAIIELGKKVDGSSQ